MVVTSRPYLNPHMHFETQGRNADIILAMQTRRVEQCETMFLILVAKVFCNVISCGNNLMPASTRQMNLG